MGNELLLTYDTRQSYRLHVRNTQVDVLAGLPDKSNEWISVCWTWDASTGLTVLWVNGKRSAHYILSPGSAVPKDVSVVLGQEQDDFGGGFDAQQSFVGDITDVHFWDYVIDPCNIKLYMDRIYITPGNVISWQELDFTTQGQVFTVKSDQ